MLMQTLSPAMWYSLNQKIVRGPFSSDASYDTQRMRQNSLEYYSLNSLKNLKYSARGPGA